MKGEKKRYGKSQACPVHPNPQEWISSKSWGSKQEPASPQRGQNRASAKSRVPCFLKPWNPKDFHRFARED